MLSYLLVYQPDTSLPSIAGSCTSRAMSLAATPTKAPPT
jgi:hypothetical protein